LANVCRRGRAHVLWAELARSRQPPGLLRAQIITGTKPGELPVELPSKFDLVLNLQAAGDLGITFPSSLRQLAAETLSKNGMQLPIETFGHLLR